MPLRLRVRNSPPRAAFTFATSPPPAEDDYGQGTPPRPPGDLLPERDMHMYGAQPLIGEAFEPGRAIVRCTRCGRAVLEWAAGEHKRICSHVLDGVPLTAKKGANAQKKADGKKRRASEASPDSDASPSKKRARLLVPEADSDDDIDPSAYKGLKKSEIKKLLKERERLKKREEKEKAKADAALRRRARAANNPLNYDRQCGVINDKGLPCSRSLTCKTHTVGAKRSVQGRTRPYDELFIEWQRAHNPNFKEPQPKRDKDKGSSAAAADRKTAAAKKRRAAVLDEDGLRFDEDGHREMEELIRATKLAGDRVRSASLTGGTRPAPRAKPPAVTAPLPSVWRTTTYEQLSMGDLLTKALAARPLPTPAVVPQRMGSISKPGPVINRGSLMAMPQGVTA